MDGEHDRQVTSRATEQSDTEKTNDDDEAYAGMTFFGDDVDFGFMAAVDTAIDFESDEDAVLVDEDELARLYKEYVPIDDEDPARLSVLNDSPGPAPSPPGPPDQLPSASAPESPTHGPHGASWTNPAAWFGSALVFIGVMIGGNDATTLGASSAHRSLSSAALDPNLTWSCLRNVSRPVSSCCQGSAWEEALSYFQLEGVGVTQHGTVRGMQADLSAPAVKGVRGRMLYPTFSLREWAYEPRRGTFTPEDALARSRTQKSRPSALQLAADPWEERVESVAPSHASEKSYERPGQAPGPSAYGCSK
jgi:hypothetical protein